MTQSAALVQEKQIKQAHYIVRWQTINCPRDTAYCAAYQRQTFTSRDVQYKSEMLVCRRFDIPSIVGTNSANLSPKIVQHGTEER